MRKVLFIGVLGCIFCTDLSAQTANAWSAFTDNRATIVLDKATKRQSFPKDYKLFSLNKNVLGASLYSITNLQNASKPIIVSLPNFNGQIEEFEINEASNFTPDLQEKFPLIRAFSGKGITDRSASVKLSISPSGFQSMVFRTETANEFIEAFSADHTLYAVYTSQRAPGRLPWTCTTDDQRIFSEIKSDLPGTNTTNSSGGELKTIRLAQSCNGEYANYFGAFGSADVALVLAAFNATLTRCNGVFEKDLALHLNLIPQTVNVIFYDPATDPYTTLSAWNQQLQATLTSVIGEANYDIGHMFGAGGGGGNAGCIGCVCTDGIKGSGITSPADDIPTGDNFDIDYVAHEYGHQLGANHTFSFVVEGSSGVNKEVGSGITIMGYAGITPQDVANHSIDIFHQASIQQIQGNLITKTCPITTVITATNATPVVAAVPNYTIPISTPFVLTGFATDANPNDVLTYCWEQNDNSTTIGANSVASPTKLTGPNWLTFPATTNPTKTFPRLSTVLAGLFVTGPLPGGDAGANIEALSSVSRTLNFRLTARDNSPYRSTPPVKVGQTAFTDMVVTTTNTSGPFEVVTPNTNESWAVGSTQEVIWSVNNTTMPPVSCANVRILLSRDGGLTFPIVLRASTPNDGTEMISIAGPTSSTARIKIEAVGNIFFDISNSNFTIIVLVITKQPEAATSCAEGSTTFSVSTTGANISYQWQVAMNGGPFTNIADGILYSGVNTATLTVNNLTTNLNGNQYRVVVSGMPFGTINSAPASLNVNPKPVVELKLVPNTTITPYLRTTLTVTASPAGSYSFQWFKNGLANPALNGNNIPLTVDDFGDYEVIATNLSTGCASRSNKVTVTPAPSTTLFIYPNPNNGSFQVRYFNQTGANVSRSINVYDSRGAKVFAKTFTLSGIYPRMDVDLNKISAKGVYFVDLLDGSGKRLKSERIVVE